MLVRSSELSFWQSVQLALQSLLQQFISDPQRASQEGSPESTEHGITAVCSQLGSFFRTSSEHRTPLVLSICQLLDNYQLRRDWKRRRTSYHCTSTSCSQLDRRVCTGNIHSPHSTEHFPSHGCERGHSLGQNRTHRTCLLWVDPIEGVFILGQWCPQDSLASQRAEPPVRNK
jgi:hypothetical protein